MQNNDTALRHIEPTSNAADNLNIYTCFSSNMFVSGNDLLVHFHGARFFFYSLLMIVPHPRKMIEKISCMQETMNVACAVHFSAGHEVELSEESKEKERKVAA